jgi:flavodoxin
MKIAVRYQSRSGNTEAVARAIAKELNVQAERVDSPITGAVDLLFLGGAVYAGTLSRHLKKFIKELRPEQVKQIALFSTAAGDQNICLKVEKLLRNKDIALYGQEFHVQSRELEAMLPKAAEYAKSVVKKD